MNKTINNKFLKLASYLMIGVLSFNICPTLLASAQNSINEPTTTVAEPTEERILMTEGASVRTTDPSGIRFKTTINKDYVKELLNSNKQFSYGTKFTIPGKEDDPIWLYAENVDEVLGVDIEYNSVIWRIPKAEYTTEVTATSFIEVVKQDDTHEKIFTTKPQTRSIAYVAAAVLNNDPEHKDKQVISSFLNGITLNVSSENINKGNQTKINVTTTFNGNNIKLPIKFVNNNTDVISVLEDGTVTGNISGKATVDVYCGSLKKEITIEVFDPYEVQNFNDADSINEFNIKIVPTQGTLNLEWLPEFEGRKGVLKVSYTHGGYINFAIRPKNAKSNYEGSWQNFIMEIFVPDQKDCTNRVVIGGMNYGDDFRTATWLDFGFGRWSNWEFGKDRFLPNFEAMVNLNVATGKMYFKTENENSAGVFYIGGFYQKPM